MYTSRSNEGNHRDYLSSVQRRERGKRTEYIARLKKIFNGANAPDVQQQ